MIANAESSVHPCECRVSREDTRHGDNKRSRFGVSRISRKRRKERRTSGVRLSSSCRVGGQLSSAGSARVVLRGLICTGVRINKMREGKVVACTRLWRFRAALTYIHTAACGVPGLKYASPSATYGQDEGRKGADARLHAQLTPRRERFALANIFSTIHGDGGAGFHAEHHQRRRFYLSAPHGTRTSVLLSTAPDIGYPYRCRDIDRVFSDKPRVDREWRVSAELPFGGAEKPEEPPCWYHHGDRKLEFCPRDQARHRAEPRDN